ncbi:MAG: TRZ/ATZ family hydrolase [Pseudomonadota bacterium]
MSEQPVDYLIHARWIIPVEPPRTVLERHAIAVADGKIAAILPSEEARSRYAAQHQIELAEHALIPGLINLHTHAAMSLMRGIADDLALMEWLKHHIWPAEGKYVSHRFVYDGTLLACAEMLKGGITCFNDMYFFPQASAQAALAARMRAVVGMVIIDSPTAYASDAQDYLSKGLATRDEFKNEPLLGFTLAPHAPYTVGDNTFEQVVTYAEQLNLPVHVHVHETRDEVEESLRQYGVRPLARMQRLGLLGPNLIAVHGVHLAAEEIDQLAMHGCHVAHCPTSNLKLASGIAPVSGLIEHKVNIGLGTDGAASNNRLDLFEEMRLASLLAKGASVDAAALPAHEALKMATLNAARALGLEHAIGSLAVGKAADIVAVDYFALSMNPCYDPISHLVYVAGRNDVSHVWVAGELLVENGKLVHLDERELCNNARYWREEIRP